MPRESRCILFDWGDTLMRDFSEYDGPMFTWPRVEAVKYTVDTLAELRTKWLLVLATNALDSDELNIRTALRRVGLIQLLDKIYCFRMIGHKKPSTEFFEYILCDLQMDKSHAIMVGDDFETDVLGANRSGIRAIWFNQRSDVVRVGEMYRTIHDFRSLQEALRAFGIASSR
ncbi:HAD family hydrolase [Caldithrix abyssi]|nr:HAD family hydrolase [Caldithrix abyssi]